MTLKHLLAGAAFASTLVGFTAANAYTTLGTETAAGGFVGSIFPGFAYTVASDGESPFDPFGAGFDTSDGLNFSGLVALGITWTQASDSSWTSLGNQTWVLPSVIPGCGSENGTTCEPVGHFTSPDPWSPSAIGRFVILDPTGGISDVIVTFNDANGAELLFSSDPSLLPTPEPATWTLMLAGFAGLGAALRTRRRFATA